MDSDIEPSAISLTSLAAASGSGGSGSLGSKGISNRHLRSESEQKEIDDFEAEERRIISADSQVSLFRGRNTTDAIWWSSQ